MLNINSFLKKSVKCMETDNKTLFWVIKVISEIFSYLLWTKTSIKYFKGTAPTSCTCRLYYVKYDLTDPLPTDSSYSILAPLLSTMSTTARPNPPRQ